MVVVAVVAILAAVATPAYFGSLRKTQRAAAVAMMSQAQQAQERFRANCPCYAHSMTNATSATCPATCPATGGDPGLGIAAVAGARYTYVVSASSATGYTLTANAVPGSSQARDTGCTSLVMTVAAGVATQTPVACWSR